MGPRARAAMSDGDPLTLVDAYARSPIGQGVVWLFAGVTTVLTVIVLLLVPGLADR
jgi:hypothetical protein